MTNYILFAPGLGRYGKKLCDGELLYLGQFLFNNGKQVKLCNHNLSLEENLSHRKRGAHSDILIINLTKNDILIGTFLTDLLEHICDLKVRYKIDYVIAIGSIASGLSRELLEVSTAINYIINERLIIGKTDDISEPEISLVQNYYNDFYNITSDYLAHINLPLGANDSFSLCTSRGCENTCTFCSYNLHTVGWKERNISGLISDMKVLNKKYDVTKFCLFDNNFGSNTIKNEERSCDLLNQIQTLSFTPELSLNIGLEGLSNIVIDNFKKASVKCILLGLESLETSTVRELYRKERNIKKVSN